MTVRWPDSDPLTLEASNAFAHLAEVIPDALHAQRSVWAIPLLKLAFDADNKRYSAFALTFASVVLFNGVDVQRHCV